MQGETVSPKLQRAIDAMALLLVPALPHTDQIYSQLQVPQEYYHYLNECGLSGAPVVSQTDPHSTGEAWGIDKESLTFFKQHGVTISAPQPEQVKLINSRMFAAKLSQSLQIGIPQTEVITSMDSFLSFVKRTPSYVLKPLYGNAGSGFIYSFGEQNIRERAQMLLKRENAFIAEPWLRKTLDIATLINISSEGVVTIRGHHRNVSNRAGAFYANIILENDPLIAPHREVLNRLSIKTAKEIFKSGYWGPLGLDSILYTAVDGSEKLAFGFDINARHPISTISYGIKDKLGNPLALMYRFIALRRLKSFDSVEDMTSHLGELNYYTKAKRGVILSSPFTHIENGTTLQKPARLSFTIVGNNAEEVESIDQTLRSKILR